MKDGLNGLLFWHDGSERLAEVNEITFEIISKGTGQLLLILEQHDSLSKLIACRFSLIAGSITLET